MGNLSGWEIMVLFNEEAVSPEEYKALIEYVGFTDNIFKDMAAMAVSFRKCRNLNHYMTENEYTNIEEAKEAYYFAGMASYCWLAISGTDDLQTFATN